MINFAIIWFSILIVLAVAVFIVARYWEEEK
jgi:hypothetical protein